jgi:hypothetical protein
MNSYHRNCHTCGVLIQLRKMPGGQWVAFEGFDQLHQCRTTASSSERQGTSTQNRPVGARATPARESKGDYEDLEFIDVEIPGLGRGKGTSQPTGTRNLSTASPAEPSPILSPIYTVRQAIDQRQVLRIMYQGRTGKPAFRNIEPMELSGSMCHAFCRLRHDWRNFRIERMASITPTGEVFAPRPLPSASQSASAYRRSAPSPNRVPPRSRSATVNPPRPPNTSSDGGLPRWIWILIVLAVLYWLAS